MSTLAFPPSLILLSAELLGWPSPPSPPPLICIPVTFLQLFRLLLPLAFIYLFVFPRDGNGGKKK